LFYNNFLHLVVSTYFFSAFPALTWKMSNRDNKKSRTNQRAMEASRRMTSRRSV